MKIAVCCSLYFLFNCVLVAKSQTKYCVINAKQNLHVLQLNENDIKFEGEQQNSLITDGQYYSIDGDVYIFKSNNSSDAEMPLANQIFTLKNTTAEPGHSRDLTSDYFCFPDLVKAHPKQTDIIEYFSGNLDLSVIRYKHFDSLVKNNTNFITTYDASDGMIRIRKNNTFFFLKKQKSINDAIAAYNEDVYDSADDFRNGVALVGMNETPTNQSYHFINKQNQQVGNILFTSYFFDGTYYYLKRYPDDKSQLYYSSGTIALTDNDSAVNKIHGNISFNDHGAQRTLPYFKIIKQLYTSPAIYLAQNYWLEQVIMNSNKQIISSYFKGYSGIEYHKELRMFTVTTDSGELLIDMAKNAVSPLYKSVAAVKSFPFYIITKNNDRKDIIDKTFNTQLTEEYADISVTENNIVAKKNKLNQDVRYIIKNNKILKDSSFEDLTQLDSSGYGLYTKKIGNFCHSGLYTRDKYIPIDDIANSCNANYIARHNMQPDILMQFSGFKKQKLAICTSRNSGDYLIDMKGKIKTAVSCLSPNTLQFLEDSAGMNFSIVQNIIVPIPTYFLVSDGEIIPGRYNFISYFSDLPFLKIGINENYNRIKYGIIDFNGVLRLSPSFKNVESFHMWNYLLLSFDSLNKVYTKITNDKFLPVINESFLSAKAYEYGVIAGRIDNSTWKIFDKNGTLLSKRKLFYDSVNIIQQNVMIVIKNNKFNICDYRGVEQLHIPIESIIWDGQSIICTVTVKTVMVANQLMTAYNDEESKSNFLKLFQSN